MFSKTTRQPAEAPTIGMVYVVFFALHFYIKKSFPEIVVFKRKTTNKTC